MIAVGIIAAAALATSSKNVGPVVGSAWHCENAAASASYFLRLAIEPTQLKDEIGRILILNSSGIPPVGTSATGHSPIRFESFDAGKSRQDPNYLAPEFVQVFSAALISFTFTWQPDKRQMLLDVRTYSKVLDEASIKRGVKYRDAGRYGYVCQQVLA